MQPTKITMASGDAVSQLVQLAVRNVKLSDVFKWTGKGHDDVQNLANFAKQQYIAREELGFTVAAIVKHPQVQAILNTDESFQAEIAAHILRAHGCIELRPIMVPPPAPFGQPAPAVS